MSSPSDKKLGTIHQGAIALIKRDLPLAYRAFATTYRSVKWERRDLALVGLSDLLDKRVYEHSKNPSILLALDWQPTVEVNQTALPDQRLLVLLDGFLQKSRAQANTIAEKKALYAMQNAMKLLERALLHDPFHIVRFSAFIILNQMPTENQRHFVLPTFQAALRQETYPALSAALEAALKR